MRFDAPEHVATWRRDGTFPKIHDAIFQAALGELDPPKGARVLDLCCSTGLLGARLRQHGFAVCFAEGDTHAITQGKSAGTYRIDPMFEGMITPATIGDFKEWLRTYNVTDVVARRCFRELSIAFDLGALSNHLAEAGVERIVLEGQRPGKTPMGPGQVQAEALTAYEIVTVYPPHIYSLEVSG